MTGKELPGKVVCNVGTTGGDLKWECGNTVSERVRLLAGTVHSTDKGVALKSADGRNYPLELANGGLHVTSGAYVLGAEDPKTSVVRAVRVISTASEEKSLAATPAARLPEQP